MVWGKVKHYLFHKDRPTTAVDIGTTGIKLMAVNLHGKVLAYGSIDLDPSKIQKSLKSEDAYLEKGLNELLSKNVQGRLPSNQVVVGLPTSQTYSRSMVLPIKSLDNIEEAIRLEAEQYIPIPISELYYDYEIIERTKQSVTVMLSAAPRKAIDVIVQAFDKNRLVPVLMEPGIAAVARLVSTIMSGPARVVLIDIGAVTSNIALVDKFIRVSGSVPVGGNTFTVKIAEKLKVSPEEAHRLKVGTGLTLSVRRSRLKNALQPSLDQIANEARKVLRYYSERLGAEAEIGSVMIVGGGSNMPGLSEYLAERIGMTVVKADPWKLFNFSNFESFNKQVGSRFMTVAGLSIIDRGDILGERND